MGSLVLLLMSLALLAAATPKAPSMLDKLKPSTPPSYTEMSSQKAKLPLPPTYFAVKPSYVEVSAENVKIRPEYWSNFRAPPTIFTPGLLPLDAGQPNHPPASFTSMFTIPGPCGFRGCGPHGSGPPFVFTINPSDDDSNEENEGVHAATLPLSAFPCGFRGCGPNGPGGPPRLHGVTFPLSAFLSPCGYRGCGPHGPGGPPRSPFTVPGRCGFRGCGPHGPGGPPGSPSLYSTNPQPGYDTDEADDVNEEEVQIVTSPLFAAPGPCGFRGCGPHGPGGPPG